MGIFGKTKLINEVLALTTGWMLSTGHSVHFRVVTILTRSVQLMWSVQGSDSHPYRTESILTNSPEALIVRKGLSHFQINITFHFRARILWHNHATFRCLCFLRTGRRYYHPSIRHSPVQRVPKARVIGDNCSIQLRKQQGRWVW